MTDQIKKAAVIGSGTMGGGIAALLAGVGVDVLLLDIPARDTKPGDPAAKRNAIVNGNLKTLQSMRPAQLFSADDLKRITTGNTEDDLGNVANADWVVEVIVERLDIKQALMARLAEVVKPTAIISSNTSGLPIGDIAEGLPEPFTKRFLGTHFFNPPRYLNLLEVIPHAGTDPAVVDFMMNYGKNVLGKGVVLCKDTPNFIGNRFMSMSGMQAMNYALDHDYTVEEVDALTGPLIGRPKTATFNLNDLVGYDIAVHVARNLYPAIADDPAREVLNHPGSAALSDEMLKRNWLGRKTGQGFYHMRRSADGGKELWALNLKTFEYEPPKQVTFESIEKHGRVKPLGERIKRLIAEPDRGGQYLFHLHGFYLAYASQKVPEITETIVNIDNAQKWGFAHEMGPFEIWDAIGVAEYVEKFEAAGYPVAKWVKDMLASGNSTFYQRDAHGVVVGYYSPQAGAYVTTGHDPMEISLSDLRARGTAVLEQNDHGILYDIGDGVLLFQFRTKQNTITGGLLDLGFKALAMLEDPAWQALVIANEGERFSIGANLADAMGAGIEGVEAVTKKLQDFGMAMRAAPKPVVVAPYNMTLGGGLEITMSGHAVVAHAELYAGLVEFGVGIIPAGGGCKELLRRVVNPVADRGANVLEPLQSIFTTIATAKVSESANQARELGFLRKADKIVMNKAHLIGEAKQYALGMAKTFQPKGVDMIYAAGRDAYAALNLGIAGFIESGVATEYDGFIARKLAYVLTGGALSQPGWVHPQVILDLERKAMMELIMEQKTQERVMYMLANNKPLRN
ncbi:MAG: 3-hydroxyacyl-CoA dehydrogenase/enoyl-CoA hydratase family protein [Chloroflexi bacterium]|nr:3-hydroxyacyl-CoA dehydrogenase/enoyl-CoA hydratase family protein [Chloroflexota bacterium]